MTPITKRQQDRENTIGHLIHEMDIAASHLSDMIDDKAFANDIYGKHARLSVETALRILDAAIKEYDKSSDF